MPPRADVPGDLLFGLLALQAGLIGQSALVAAFHAWCRDSRRPMAEILVEQGGIDPAEREVVAGLVAAHLKRHGGDREGSLAALDVDASTVEVLARVGDPDLEATIGRVGLGSSRHGKDGAAAPPRAPDASETVDYGGPDAPAPRYRIVRKLGAGGLGIVFVAVDAVLHREVALKQVRPDRDGDEARARFLVEAEVTGGLEHPGIVPVHDQGTSDGGRPYYVMRLVRGDTLKDAIAAFHNDPALDGDPAARALGLQKLLRQFLDVCHAVDYAHSRGILHRDIKPSNVVVGKHGETSLIDWGLAKSVGRSGASAGSDERTLRPASGSDSAETRPGSAFGSLPYMPREQAEGDLARIGPRSDVYALGATLYHVLTGRPPFQGTDDALILADVRAGTFPRPRAVDPTIARPLEAVCLKAMALEPEGRYGSARELAEEVERWLADAPVTAWREPASVRFRRWARRHRPLVAAAAVLLVMATLASAGAAVLLDRHRRRLEAEQLLTSAARAEAESHSLKVLDAVEAMLTHVFDKSLASVPKMDLLRRDLARDASTIVEALLRQRPRDPTVRLYAAKVLRRVANIDRQLNQPDPARSNYDRAVDLLAVLGDEFPGEPSHRDLLAETLIDEAEMLRLQGRFREAEPFYRRALAVVQALREAHPSSDAYRRTEATNRTDLGAALSDACRYADARAMFDQAEFLWRPLTDTPGSSRKDRLMMAITRINLAEIRRKEGHPSEAVGVAEDAVRRAKELRDQDPTTNDINYVLAYTVGELALDLAADPARHREAREAVDQSVDLLRKLTVDYPKRAYYHNRLAQALAGRAEIHEAAGRPTDAEADLIAARDVLKRLVDASPTSAEYHGQLGLVLARLAQRTLARGDAGAAATTARTALDELKIGLDANPDACPYSEAMKRLDAVLGPASALRKT